MREFQGRSVFLTGAASGIGRALALQLADAGCRLFLVDISADGLESLRLQLSDRPVTVHVHVCDLSRPQEISDAVAAALKLTDGIDLLVD